MKHLNKFNENISGEVNDNPSLNNYIVIYKSDRGGVEWSSSVSSYNVLELIEKIKPTLSDREFNSIREIRKYN